VRTKQCFSAQNALGDPAQWNTSQIIAEAEVMNRESRGKSTKKIKGEEWKKTKEKTTKVMIKYEGETGQREGI
jgi:hypothetical protein